MRRGIAGQLGLDRHDVVAHPHLSDQHVADLEHDEHNQPDEHNQHDEHVQHDEQHLAHAQHDHHGRPPGAPARPGDHPDPDDAQGGGPHLRRRSQR
ncbi:hypothetical protein [Angustibacter sp. Root456]|uniref:hypothetical protein n=1 Tax=Angustibacter sp. Root456 TaxID=1736539 RepID=UPI00190FEFA9|nr:hypothetical protein [Angustibacter sp. Root456]